MSANTIVKSFIDRILRLKEEQDSIGADIREIYAEAKGSGFDKTALGEVVSHLRKVEKKGRHAVEERGALFDLYLNAYEQPSHAHTREASKQVDLGTAPEASISKASSVETAVLGTTPLTVETGEITDEVEPCDCAERAPLGEYYRCPKCDAEWHADGEITDTQESQGLSSPTTSLAALEGDESAAPISHSQIPSPRPADKAEAPASSPETSATYSTSDVTNLTDTREATSHVAASHNPTRPPVSSDESAISEAGAPIAAASRLSSDPYDPGPIPAFLDRRQVKLREWEEV